MAKEESIVDQESIIDEESGTAKRVMVGLRANVSDEEKL